MFAVTSKTSRVTLHLGLWVAVALTSACGQRIEGNLSQYSDYTWVASQQFGLDHQVEWTSRDASELLAPTQLAQKHCNRRGGELTLIKAQRNLALWPPIERNDANEGFSEAFGMFACTGKGTEELLSILLTDASNHPCDPTYPDSCEGYRYSKGDTGQASIAVRASNWDEFYALQKQLITQKMQADVVAKNKQRLDIGEVKSSPVREGNYVCGIQTVTYTVPGEKRGKLPAKYVVANQTLYATAGVVRQQDGMLLVSYKNAGTFVSDNYLTAYDAKIDGVPVNSGINYNWVNAADWTQCHRPPPSTPPSPEQVTASLTLAHFNEHQ